MFVSSEANAAMKERLTEPWFSLATFSYPEATRKLVRYCNGLFDSMYGQKHFTWRCFLPSSIISVFSVLLFSQLFGRFSHFPLFQNVFDFWAVALFSLLINVWAEYFSLVETRWLLRLAERVRVSWLPLLLILDIACTSVIYIIGLWLFVYLPVAVAGLQVNPLGALRFFWSNLANPLSNPAVAAIVWSTFTTSIIFYLHCFLVLGLKCLRLTRTPLMTFLERLQKQNRLLTAMGVFLATLILLITIISKCVCGL